MFKPDVHEIQLMNAVQTLRTRLTGLLPDRGREHYDPFDDVDRVVGRTDLDETETLEHPLPETVAPADRVRVLVLPASGEVLELDESLLRVTDGVLEADYPALEGAFDIRVRVERKGESDG